MVRKYIGDVGKMEDIIRNFSLHLREVPKNNVQRMRECCFTIHSAKLFSRIIKEK